jgi:hypothetical protein
MDIIRDTMGLPTRIIPEDLQTECRTMITGIHMIPVTIPVICHRMIPTTLKKDTRLITPMECPPIWTHMITTVE